ncbi:ABC transporter ATP-binding protein [Sinisalibacter aestuarii]|uniref:ABC transporter ATP-binding protein n=1 Tax=Sinisalibacter aestuarii TaxID=2949426 RepID=A0ABQ5LUV8_9RHOB|nr:dipeptide ABC transporter ATP-binding protein [Sinisalibacter aestuarii]GKY88210.1 ABC transporter ATP-binding protein [Sinisalibacter aestuarii]
MIRLQNLSLAIHDYPILDDVSLTIAPGKVTGLVGESGSGKSMTALAVMGLLPHGSRISGHAWLDEGDVLAKSEREMCALRGNRVGMIFQEPMTALNPVKTIGDQVAETLVIHGKATKREARDVARERLARVGLPEERFPLSRYPHELSGGQRQRVCIAMAVALNPELLIADEPTTALDVTTQAQILDLLKGLVEEEGMSLLLITHDLAVVAGMADHVAVMQAGRIVEQGPTEALFRTMAHPYTRKLFAASSHQPDRGARAEGTPLLTVENAVRDYPTARQGLLGRAGTFRAVKGVSFTLERGESLGLVGESGCGKSTLTRAILGLDALQGGRIALDGQEIHAGPHLDPSIRRRMQVVFQDPYGSFNPRWKVERLVAEPFHLMDSPGNIRDRVAAALADVGLEPEAMGRYIHEFSGGQRQRIAIARALITNPDLIILDEAVSALDVSIRAQILDLLARLRAEHGLSYMFISHDLSVVQAITDRVLVMQAGEIVERGATAQVFASPAHPYTRTLIAATPKIPAEWQGVTHD